MESNPELVAGLLYAAGLLLSALMRYIPGFNTWYAGLGKWGKFVILVGLVIGVEVLVFVASCAGLWRWVSCDSGGFLRLLVAFVTILGGSQTGHIVFPKTNAVAKANK